jgi:hypothetical protein
MGIQLGGEMRIHIWILLPEGMKSIELSDGALQNIMKCHCRGFVFVSQFGWMSACFDERDQQA